MSTRTRRGQALIELAVGMLTLALIVSALCVFVRYITRSLEIENHIRAPGQATHTAEVQLDDFAADKVFGTRTLDIKEPRGATDRTIQ